MIVCNDQKTIFVTNALTYQYVYKIYGPTFRVSLYKYLLNVSNLRISIDYDCGHVILGDTPHPLLKNGITTHCTSRKIEKNDNRKLHRMRFKLTILNIYG